MNKDGSGLEQITNNTVYDGTPSWSPDGTKLVFETARDGGDWDLERASGDINSTVLQLTGLQGTLASATLTAGDETPVLTTSDDTIVADAASTLNAGDVIDGLGGDDTLTISQIAWLLGYQEVSAFTHAFKRWTGMTPREARSRTIANGG